MDEKDWYKNRAVQYELVKQLKNRELCLLVPKHCDKDMKKRNIRTLRCHNWQGFEFILNALNYFGRDTTYNFYVSVAEYVQGLPMQTLNLKARDNSDWVENHWRSMISYPLFLDIDAPSHKDMNLAHYSAQQIKKEFDKSQIPYTLLFSGMGFHFIISQDVVMPESGFNPHKPDSVYKRCYEIAKSYYNDISEFIDTSIYDSRRVRKLAYSIAIYEKKKYICWAFNSDEEFQRFQLKYYEYNKQNIEKLIPKIYCRGVPILKWQEESAPLIQTK